jgi:hypothetical protein
MQIKAARQLLLGWSARFAGMWQTLPHSGRGIRPCWTGGAKARSLRAKRVPNTTRPFRLARAICLRLPEAEKYVRQGAKERHEEDDGKVAVVRCAIHVSLRVLRSLSMSQRSNERNVAVRTSITGCDSGRPPQETCNARVRLELEARRRTTIDAVTSRLYAARRIVQISPLMSTR